jgi:TP901 family phage tail tape measure protein
VAVEAGRAYVSVQYDPRSLATLEATTRARGRSLAGMWGSAAARAGKLIGIGVGVGAVAAGVGIAKAVNAAGDFQEELNVLQSVSGATNAELDRMQRLSIALGRDIHLPATSALDAAVAMTELAKGGLNVHDAMAAARGTLQLAAAGEVDVGSAASISATALNAFGLAGSQAGHVADLLAGAANASAGEVVDFAEGLQYAGTAAHAAGQDIDLTVAALAEMANAGLSGSVAGSSLAQALRSLQAPTAKAQDAIKKFGLDVYDAHGNMKPLDEIAQTFTSHLGDMTQKQQNQTLATIFGSRAVQAARIVFLGGRDALDKYRDRVARAGNAQRLAAARTKGWTGALNAFQSNVETLGIQIGLRLLPTLTNAARELSKFVDFLDRVARARNMSVGLRIIWQGVGELGQMLRNVLFGHGARIKPVRIPAGKIIEFQREGATSGLVGALTASIANTNWRPVGEKIAAGITAGLDIGEKATRQMAQGLLDNSDVIAEAGLVIALKMVATMLDPGFWADHWRTVLVIVLSVIPVGRLLEGGTLIARLLTRPLGRLFLAAVRRLPGIAQDAVVALEVLFRGGFRRIASTIVRDLSGAASAVPNRFQTAFGAVWRFATEIFGRVAGAIRDRIGNAIGRLADRIQNSVIGRTLTWLSKVLLIQLAFNVVVGIIDKIKAGVQWLIDHIPDIPSLPSLPSFHIPGTATGGVVNSAQVRLVGEAGPEAIIPLRQLPDLLGRVEMPRGGAGTFTLRGRMHISNWRDGMAEVDLRITDAVDASAMGARA